MKYLRLPKSRILRFGIFFFATLFLSPIVYRAWIFHRSHQQFVAVIERLDATDPNWRMEKFLETKKRIEEDPEAWDYLKKLIATPLKKYEQTSVSFFAYPLINHGSKGEFDLKGRGLLEQNAEVLGALRKLRKFDEEKKWDGTTLRTPSQLSPEDSPVIHPSLVDLLILDVIFQLQLGNKETLIQDLEAILVLPRYYNRNWLSQPMLYHEKMFSCATTTLVFAINSTEFTESQINRLIDCIQCINLPKIETDYNRFLRANFFEHLPRNNGGELRPKTIRSRPISIKVPFYGSFPKESTQRYIDHIRYFPYEEEDFARILSEFTSKINLLERAPADMSNWKAYLDETCGSNERKDNPLHNAGDNLRYYEEQRREILRLLLIERFRIANKRWPKSIEDIPEFPKDVYLELPCQLSKHEKGLLVYRARENAIPKKELMELEKPENNHIGAFRQNPFEYYSYLLLNPELRMK